MSKLLLVLLVVGVVLWLIGGRRRVRPPDDAGAARQRRDQGKGRHEDKGQPAAPMLACLHCGVHVPQPDALIDARGGAFCSEAHRLAGPR